jgi:hypothetical protein
VVTMLNGKSLEEEEVASVEKSWSKEIGIDPYSDSASRREDSHSRG